MGREFYVTSQSLPPAPFMMPGAQLPAVYDFSIVELVGGSPKEESAHLGDIKGQFVRNGT